MLPVIWRPRTRIVGLKVKCVTQGSNSSERAPHSESCHTHWNAFNYKVEFFRIAKEITYSAIFMGKCTWCCYPCLPTPAPLCFWLPVTTDLSNKLISLTVWQHVRSNVWGGNQWIPKAGKISNHIANWNQLHSYWVLEKKCCRIRGKIYPHPAESREI